MDKFFRNGVGEALAAMFLAVVYLRVVSPIPTAAAGANLLAVIVGVVLLFIVEKWIRSYLPLGWKATLAIYILAVCTLPLVLASFDPDYIEKLGPHNYEQPLGAYVLLWAVLIIPLAITSHLWAKKRRRVSMLSEEAAQK